jgi:hypothetical protein
MTRYHHQTENDRFWTWLVKKVRRPPLILDQEQAEKEFENAPEAPLSEDEIDRIVRRVCGGNGQP